MTRKIPTLVHFGGALDVVELSDGSIEFRVYATRRHALAAGLSKEEVDVLFYGLLEDAPEPCYKSIGPPKGSPSGDAVVTCSKKACKKTCVVYSMPKDGDPEKDWKKESDNPCSHDTSRRYKCECE